MLKNETTRSTEYTMLYFLKDPSNICSLTGLLSSFIGIYFAITGKYLYALIAVLWAVIFDWADGMIARRIKDRTDYHRAIGTQLDSLIDIVSLAFSRLSFCYATEDSSRYLYRELFSLQPEVLSD